MFDSPSPSGPATTTSKSFMGALGGDSMLEATTGATLPVPPTAAAPPPMFGSASGNPGKRPARKPTGSFMGNAAITPAVNQLGQNTLMGQ